MNMTSLSKNYDVVDGDVTDDVNKIYDVFDGDITDDVP